MSVGAKRAMNDQESQQPSGEASTDPRAERQRDRGRRRHRPFPKHLEASINMDELRELIGLINENALTDFELEREGFHVKIGRNLYPPQPAVPSVPPVAEQHAIPAATHSAVHAHRPAVTKPPGATERGRCR